MAQAEGKKPKSKVVKIALVVVASLLVLGGIVVGTMYATGFFGHDKTDQQANADAADQAGNEEGDAGGDEGDDAEAPKGPAIYMPLEPAFVVNFQGAGKAKFLQVSVEVMARDPKVIEQVTQHMPAIRNSLILLFSSQNYDDITTAEGKEALRAKALTEVQTIMENETGDTGVESVYFTSFVMQ
ncbi:MAG: hypothetical protein A2V90_07730 [Gammaproteobacteria bacterium RBG_16_57_12]|nr:MAG: hypothetical protein A2V90_07730 [Gammaproteobacteria bacterium RBG_16_57_12]